MDSPSRSAPVRWLSDTDAKHFDRDGFIVVRGLTDLDFCRRMEKCVYDSLNPLIAPLEYEADVRYPGGPADRLAPGGDTPRRLLHAYTRDALSREWATSPPITASVMRLLTSDHIKLSQNHHNCVMTKYPSFSSETRWHQDIRYWSFDRPDLVTVWLALGEEGPANGGLALIPRTHRLELDRGRFDAELFVRGDLRENQELIQTAKTVRYR